MSSVCLCGVDLVWSDPEEVDTWAVSPRGAGWLFGNKVTNEVRLLELHLLGMSDCRIFGTLSHFSHILAKYACRIFFPHILAFLVALSILCSYFFQFPDLRIMNIRC